MALNSAARLLVGLGKYQHITPVPREVLRWLSLPRWIQFKTATQTFAESEASGLPTSVTLPAQSTTGCPGLRSAERGDLFVPRTRTTRL